MDKERMDFLLSIDEVGAKNLSIDDWYDRTRLLRRKLANEMLENIKIGVSVPKDKITAPRASNEPSLSSKYWRGYD